MHPLETSPASAPFLLADLLSALRLSTRAIIHDYHNGRNLEWVVDTPRTPDEPTVRLTINAETGGWCATRYLNGRNVDVYGVGLPLLAEWMRQRRAAWAATAARYS
jgi:hypothetical protein